MCRYGGRVKNYSLNGIIKILVENKDKLNIQFRRVVLCMKYIIRQKSTNLNIYVLNMSL